ncbi:Gfo/Idh/MocA family oxidoreductase [Candidatus Pelagibacter ubique]|nr:Gfo/Idh/MocA family oxidoreductase [Candidatus Pelagibacter ubique]
MKNIKIFIVGAGSIGKRHIRNAISIGINPDNIISLDKRDDRLEEVKKLGVKKTFKDFDLAIKEDFDAAIICSPTSMHIEQSLKLAKLKKHLLIEKPLDSKLDGAEELLKASQLNKLTIMIAYIFRFSPAIKFIKKKLEENVIGKILYFRGEFSEYLPDWHPYEDYRTFYMSSKEQGGGSILDQCHIMDLAHHLIGEFSSVIAINTKVSNLEIKADDISELIVRHKNGVISSIHTDIFGRAHRKSIEIKGEQGNILWDFYKNEVEIYNSENKKSKKFTEFDKDFNNCYIEELTAFITSFTDEKKSVIPLEDGIDTMKLILAAEKSEDSRKEELA